MSSDDDVLDGEVVSEADVSRFEESAPNIVAVLGELPQFEALLREAGPDDLVFAMSNPRLVAAARERVSAPPPDVKHPMVLGTVARENVASFVLGLIQMGVVGWNALLLVKQPIEPEYLQLGARRVFYIGSTTTHLLVLSPAQGKPEFLA